MDLRVLQKQGKTGEYTGMQKCSVVPAAQPSGELEVDNSWFYTPDVSLKNK